MPLTAGPVRLRFLLLGFLALAGLALAVERLWITDHEAIEALVGEAADAVEAQEFGRLEAVLDAGFEVEGRDRAATIDWIAGLWRRHRPMGLSAEVLACEVDGDGAKARILARTVLLARPVEVRADLDLLRTGDGWRVVAATWRWTGP